MTRLLPVVALAVAALALPSGASADFGFKGDWGTWGDASGQFHGPSYVDVAPDGSVWVAEEDRRVQKFTAEGQYLTQVQVGQFGAGPVATDGAGNLYVGNRDTYKVEKLDPNGAPLGTIGSGFGSAPGQLQDICGLDADAAGNVYVSDGRSGYCDSTPRIQKFDPSGTLVKEIKLTAKGDPDGVGDLAVDAAGNILVADSSHFGNSEVVRLSPDGAVTARFGSRGSGPAQFADGAPTSIALAPDGTIYAVDAGNGRIQHLSADGGFLGQFGTAPAFRALAVAPGGDVYVTRARATGATAENAGDLGTDSVMRFGQGAPPAPPAPLTTSPAVQIALGAPLKKACGLRDPETAKPIKDCTGYREAAIEWSAGCPAQGPLARRSWRIGLGRYAQVAPARLPAETASTADGGSATVVLRPGSRVSPSIEAGCTAYTQPDGEPVAARGAAKGNTVTTAPVAYTGYMEYSRSPKGRLLGNHRGQRVRGAIRRGREVRLYWAAKYDSRSAGARSRSRSTSAARG